MPLSITAIFTPCPVAPCCQAVIAPELTAPFDISMPAISRHLKVLEQAGLVARTRHAQWRPVQLNAAPLAELANWVERYRRHWDQNFARMDAYLAELQKGNPDGPKQ